MSSPTPIIDSHIHLYPSTALSTLPWCTPSHPLASQHSLPEFLAATSSAASPAPAPVSGFVAIESDRATNDASTDWAAPLDEVAWMRRLATGTLLPEEGGPGEGKLCLGLVPWAPVVLGAEKLGEYLGKAEEVAGEEAWGKVKGFRFLLQERPAGTALGEGFVEGLKVLGKRGFVFEVGVDQHRRGRGQLEEVVEMIDRAHEGVEEGEKVVFVLDHLCKPDLTIVNQTDPSFIAWRTAMFTLSKCRKTYMKLSGCFSELPDKLKARPAEDIFAAILPWLAVVVAAFGPGRIMFGSDWPVCTVGAGDDAWKKWHKVVDMVCDLAGLSADDQAMLWGGTAKVAYKLEA